MRRYCSFFLVGEGIVVLAVAESMHVGTQRQFPLMSIPLFDGKDVYLREPIIVGKGKLGEQLFKSSLLQREIRFI